MILKNKHTAKIINQVKFNLKIQKIKINFRIKQAELKMTMKRIMIQIFQMIQYIAIKNKV